jgi:hypothetical protein
LCGARNSSRPGFDASPGRCSRKYRSSLKNVSGVPSTTTSTTETTETTPAPTIPFDAHVIE